MQLALTPPHRFPNEPTRRQAIVGVAMAIGGLAVVSTKAWAEAAEEISHTAESIHQKVVKRPGSESTKRSRTPIGSVTSCSSECIIKMFELVECAIRCLEQGFIGCPILRINRNANAHGKPRLLVVI